MPPFDSHCRQEPWSICPFEHTRRDRADIDKSAGWALPRHPPSHKQRSVVNPWLGFPSKVGWALLFFGAVWWGNLLTVRERAWLVAFPMKVYGAVRSRLG